MDPSPPDTTTPAPQPIPDTGSIGHGVVPSLQGPVRPEGFIKTPPPSARVTVVERIYFSRDRMAPTSVVSNYCVDLPESAGEEQPFVRQSKIKEGEWSKLETGWLTACSMLLISNEEGRGRQKVPTDEEKKATAARVIQLGIMVEIVEEPEGPPAKSRTMYDPPVVRKAVKPIKIVVPFAVIRPGESVRFSPSQLDQIVMTCESGEARYVLTVLPG